MYFVIQFLLFYYTCIQECYFHIQEQYFKITREITTAKHNIMHLLQKQYKKYIIWMHFVVKLLDAFYSKAIIQSYIDNYLYINVCNFCSYISLYINLYT